MGFCSLYVSLEPLCSPQSAAWPRAAAGDWPAACQRHRSSCLIAPSAGVCSAAPTRGSGAPNLGEPACCQQPACRPTGEKGRELTRGCTGPAAAARTFSNRRWRAARTFSDRRWRTTTLAGSGEPGFADGQGAAARFSWPRELALDADEGVRVANSKNRAVRRVTMAGRPGGGRGCRLGRRGRGRAIPGIPHRVGGQGVQHRGLRPPAAIWRAGDDAGSEACVWGSGRTRQPAHALTPRARAVRPNGRRSGPSKPRPEGARCAPPSLTANSWPPRQATARCGSARRLPAPSYINCN